MVKCVFLCIRLCILNACATWYSRTHTSIYVDERQTWQKLVSIALQVLFNVSIPLQKVSDFSICLLFAKDGIVPMLSYYSCNSQHSEIRLKRIWFFSFCRSVWVHVYVVSFNLLKIEIKQATYYIVGLGRLQTPYTISPNTIIHCFW